MDSKTFNSIIGFYVNIAVILTLLCVLALTVVNTIYYKKLADDNGSTSITYDTANAFYAVNLVIAIMTFLVLIMYFFKNIVITMLFMIFLVLTVTGIVAITLTNTIYFKKLWDDGGSTSDVVSGKDAKNLFFFNLTLTIVSLIVFLIFLYRWYNLYNVAQAQQRSIDISSRDVRGYNIPVEELSSEEYIDRLAATTPQPRQRFAPRGYSDKKALSPIAEEVNQIPNDDEEAAMRQDSMSPIAMMSSPIPMDTSIYRSPYTPSTMNTSIFKDTQREYDISTRLDFGEEDEVLGNEEVRTYRVIGSYESESDYV